MISFTIRYSLKKHKRLITNSLSNNQRFLKNKIVFIKFMTIFAPETTRDRAIKLS
jgi:hypothetical protein